jgi:prepilin signal peptidase PulO-like enzyme (type II secretory pathway)
LKADGGGVIAWISAAVQWIAVLTLGVACLAPLCALPLAVLFALQRRFGVESPESWSGALVTAALLWVALWRLDVVDRAVDHWMAAERRLRHRLVR